MVVEGKAMDIAESRLEISRKSQISQGLKSKNVELDCNE